MKPVGYPYKPENHNASSCGTAVLAAILGVSTKEAENMIAQERPKGYRGFTNVSDIRRVLESKGLIFHCENKVWRGLTRIGENSSDDFIALFVQINGPWVDKGWRSAYNHTHWALLHKNHMLDVNNIHFTTTNYIPWISLEEWNDTIMPMLVGYEHDATGWYVKGGYQVLEPKFL